MLMHLDFNTFKELRAVICCSFWYCCGSTLSFITDQSYRRIGIRDGGINNHVCIGTLVSVTSIVKSRDFLIQFSGGIVFK